MTPEEKMTIIKRWCHDCVKMETLEGKTYYLVWTIYDKEPRTMTEATDDEINAIDQVYLMVRSTVAAYIGLSPWGSYFL